MIMLEGWTSYVVVDEVDVIKAIRKDVYVVINLLCIGKC